MSGLVKNISSRLSLRPPQLRSLEILDRVMTLAEPLSKPALKEMLAALKAEFPELEDFERAFPSLCFSLATGVGKTRLMGAFVAYLHLEHGIRHFFVLAPNLTIYKKLTEDFTPNTSKYVFRGISEFAIAAPHIVTGETYDRSELLLLTDPYDVTIFIFNISKFNVRRSDARKIRKLSEYLGESFFEYLAGLEDLVLIMDEAHRYRADTSMQSLEDLKPVLGLELTATPQIEKGKKSGRFKNIVIDYPLAQAMNDGFVKEPAVATRADFDAQALDGPALQRLKLEDGIRVHESTKVALEVYAGQQGVRRVKPFMLVIASDTTHAAEIVALMEDQSFFRGRYKGRIIQVHSGQRGAEKDENIERLLAVESADEPTEIVVHVNMLKEGWDVTNLYTIVPLRTADSRTLVEQSIGRGLRLPYGKRTGVPAVDRLTIVAHDRFQDIVDEAKKGGYSFSVLKIGEDIPDVPRETVVVRPLVESLLGVGQGSSDVVEEGDGAKSTADSPFKTTEERAMAIATLEAIRKLSQDPNIVPGHAALESKDVQAKLVEVVGEKLAGGQRAISLEPSSDRIKGIVRDATEIYVKHTIAIPRVIVLPVGDVRAGFREFELELSSFRQPPASNEILVQHLASNTREFIGALKGGHEEPRLEDYVVRGLIDFDDVCYDEHADLLYSLAAKVVAHLSGYLKDEDEVRNVLAFHQKQLCELVHTQMRDHAWEEVAAYQAVVSRGFTEVVEQPFARAEGEKIRPFDAPIQNRSEIRRMLFGGFAKCLYPTQKFESDPERRFAVLVDKNDSTVLKWFKPGRSVFQIRYSGDKGYEPDFVVETETEKLLCEPKQSNQMKQDVVLAKARAAATWCKHASAHELEHGGKPWRYLLIPHDAISDNKSLAGLVERYTFDEGENP